jgi:hypothetical protein
MADMEGPPASDQKENRTFLLKRKTTEQFGKGKLSRRAQLSHARARRAFETEHETKDPRTKLSPSQSLPATASTGREFEVGPFRSGRPQMKMTDIYQNKIQLKIVFLILFGSNQFPNVNKTVKTT